MYQEATKQVTFSWQSVCVYAPGVETKGKLKRIELIENVSGIAKPGQLLAIMGASGAGKTTLLNVLNYRNKGDLRVSGVLKLNGDNVTSSEEIASVSGYVEQDFLFYETLTVREHLKFHAMLKMDRNVSYTNRMNRVDDIIVELDLKKCENTLIGTEDRSTSGISGGEKRRLAFATKILNDPPLLFCDEPTSGLDSYMALSVVECMKKLAQQGGKTIICTIHQPSSEIFEMFDRLCLLAEGRLAYFGDRDKVAKFFASQNLIVPKSYNEGEYYIEKLAIVPAKALECKQNVKEICDAFYHSSQMKEIELEIAASSSNPSFSLNEKKGLYKSNSFQQLKWLFWRQGLITIRKTLTTNVRLFQTLLTSLFLGLLFFQQKQDQSSVFNIRGILFLINADFGFLMMTNVANTFPSEIAIFLREHHSGTYRVINYYLTKLLVELPVFIILTLIYVTIIYWMVNLNNNFDRYVICVVTILLVMNVAVAFGVLISAIAPSLGVAMSLITPLTTPIYVFGGFFMNYDTIPSYFILLKKLSWLGFANEILTVNQWDGVENINCRDNSTTCFRTGADVIRDQRMNKANVNQDFIHLASIYFAFILLAFLVLLFKSYRHS